MEKITEMFIVFDDGMEKKSTFLNPFRRYCSMGNNERKKLNPHSIAFNHHPL
jgi:hypothetical protein